MKRGNAKANAMNNNLNNYIKHTYSSKKWSPTAAVRSRISEPIPIPPPWNTSQLFDVWEGNGNYNYFLSNPFKQNVILILNFYLNKDVQFYVY